jgi:DNA-binding response OmpR family regulator
MQPQSVGGQFAEILVVKDNEDLIQPLEFTLEADICTIGRALTCYIVLLQHLVTRIHAKIERDGPRYVLRDAQSANGTFINRQRIHEPHLLHYNDQIGLGAPKPLFRFLDPDPTSRAAVPLHYDAKAMKFFLYEQALDLPPGQFRLLLYLYQHVDEVCTRESCAQAIWGRDYDPGMDAAALDDTVSGLRGKFRQVVSKLREVSRQIEPTADLIQTRRGLGYELVL